MAYRGEDLDLRTPPGANPGPAEPLAQAEGGVFVGSGRRERSPPAQRSAPIWVDDTVLDCCNYAFDVALAHRSAEVRLEHLLFALTRIEAAADILESRGIRVAAAAPRSRHRDFDRHSRGPRARQGTPRRVGRRSRTRFGWPPIRAYRRQMAVGVGDILLRHSRERPRRSAGCSACGRWCSARAGRPCSIPSPATAPQERVRVPFFGGDPTPAAEVPSFATAFALPALSRFAPRRSRKRRAHDSSRELTNERKIISGALHDLQRRAYGPSRRNLTSRRHYAGQDPGVVRRPAA